MPATLAENLRRETISQMRYHIDNPEHRFFLALLMNVQNSKDIQALITERYPDQSPNETILRWAEELIEPADFGLTLLDAAFPETIEVDIDTQFDLLIDTLKHALNESPESNTTTAEYPEIHAVLSGSCLRPLFC